MSGQYGHDNPTACLVAKQFSEYGGMDELAIERSFNLRKLRWLLMCLAHLLTCYQRVCVQPGTGRRPVDWWRNYMVVLYSQHSNRDSVKS